MAALSLAIACLPDLDVAPPTSSAAPLGPVCGDGLVTSDRGEECDPGDAGALGCKNDCTVDCPGAIDPATKHCYFATNAASTYEAALYACGFLGAHVVTIGSADERRFVHELALVGAPSSAREFWVGLEDTGRGYRAAREREPGWRPGCRGCFAAVPDDAGDIPRAAGDDAGGCVVDGPGAPTYLGAACEGMERRVICEREPTGSALELRAGGFGIAFADASALRKQWFYVPVPVTASEAVDGCNALGGKLAMFDTAYEREAVLSQIQNIARPGDEGVWIGLASTGAAFVWDDGKAEGERPSVWGAGEPRVVGAPARVQAFLPPLALDVQLGRAIEPNATRPYVCER